VRESSRGALLARNVLDRCCAHPRLTAGLPEGRLWLAAAAKAGLPRFSAL